MDASGTTALHAGAYYGADAIVEHLISAGMKVRFRLSSIVTLQVNTLDSQGLPPVFYACEMGHAGAVAALHAGRCNMDYRDAVRRSQSFYYIYNE